MQKEKIKHWCNIVVNTSEEKYKIIDYARMLNINFSVSGYYDNKYMIELYMTEEQRNKMNKWCEKNIGGSI